MLLDGANGNGRNHDIYILTAICHVLMYTIRYLYYIEALAINNSEAVIYQNPRL